MQNHEEAIKNWKQSKLKADELEEIQLFSVLWSKGVRSLEIHGRMLELCLDHPTIAAHLIAAHYDLHEDEMVADFLAHHLAPYMRYLPLSEELEIPEQQAWQNLIHAASLQLRTIAEHHLKALPLTPECWKEQVTGETREQFEVRQYAA